MKWYRELSKVKGRQEHGYFLLEGTRAVTQVIASHPNTIAELLIDESVVDSSKYSDFTIRLLLKSQIESIASSKSPQGIIACVRIPLDSYSPTLPSCPGERIVVLEDVQDPGNVGTIIRTAAAFNFSGVLLSQQCADPFSPKVVQSTAGAIFLPWIRRCDRYLDVINNLKSSGYYLYCTDIRGAKRIDFSNRHQLIIALGNEGSGVSSQLRNIADELFAIPMRNTNVESLNVAVSGAITLFAASRKCGW